MEVDSCPRVYETRESLVSRMRKVGEVGLLGFVYKTYAAR